MIHNKNLKRKIYTINIYKNGRIRENRSKILEILKFMIREFVETFS